VRYWSDRPIADPELRQVLLAARWAPTAGNRRLHRFVAVRDPTTIRLIRAFSPGISGYPSALIVICIDGTRVARFGNPKHQRTLYIDVGTAAENMLLAAHAIGLGGGPMTSFSQEAVRVILELPPSMSPELIVCLGYPAAHRPAERVLPDRPLRLQDLVIMERFDPESMQTPIDKGGHRA